MLSQLHIENIAVIKEEDLLLDNGFNVLTGETGAGKSILIDSINLALGERVSKQIIRAGAKSARVTAVFRSVSAAVCKKLTELGLPQPEEDSLIITRSLSSDGRGSCRIGGRPVTVSNLREIGRMLVNIHGQHDNQVLLSPENHVHYLDLYAENDSTLAQYRAVYQKLRHLQAQLNKLKMGDAEKNRRIELLKYQVDEIEGAHLHPEEEERLIKLRDTARYAEKISALLIAASDCLEDGEENSGATALVHSAADQLVEVSELDETFSSLSDKLQNVRYELEDCAESIRNHLDFMNDQSMPLDEIEQRLDVIFKLKTKYGETVSDILRFAQKAKTELDAITSSEEQIAELRQNAKILAVQLKKAALALTKNRQLAAKTLQENIRKELTFLEMPRVRFQIELTPLEKLGPSGAERVEMLLAANPGAPLLPLAKIASGGEISRVMLAIKNVLMDDIDTVIFDEIDTGVSGRTAYQIGLKLKQVATSRQVVCVTHLAQIAVQADRHILIEKTVQNNQTYTHLHMLDFEGQKRELARIIGGAEITPLTLQNAEEMLCAAHINTTNKKEAED